MNESQFLAAQEELRAMQTQGHRFFDLEMKAMFGSLSEAEEAERAKLMAEYCALRDAVCAHQEPAMQRIINSMQAD